MAPSLKYSSQPDFGLNGSIGTGHSNKGDVLKIRRALQKTGHGRFPRKPATNVTPGLMQAIEGFQLDFGLKEDGIVEPGGPTERAIGLTVAKMETDGERGLGAMRTLFQKRADAGLAFRPDPNNRAGMLWRDRKGALLTDDQAEAITVSAKTKPAATPTPQSSGTSKGVAAAAPQISQAPAPSRPIGSARPIAPIIPEPAYRQSVLKQQRNVWPRWSQAVRSLPSGSPNEQRAYAEIFAAEGGNEVDRFSNAASGITPATLDELIDRGLVKGIGKGTPPKTIRLDRRPEIYRAYFNFALDRAGGSTTLSRIPDADAAAALADTLFRHGRTGGAKILQNAINSVNPGAVSVSGPAGPETLREFIGIASDQKKVARLLDAIGNERARAVRGTRNEKGEMIRIDHFRFQKPAGSPSSP
jgi:hypothetical protein